MEEELAFSDWINTNLGDDPGLGHILPIQVHIHVQHQRWYRYRYTCISGIYTHTGTPSEMLQVQKQVQVHLYVRYIYRYSFIRNNMGAPELQVRVNVCLYLNRCMYSSPFQK